MGLDRRSSGPWRLPQNRVSRFYRGGAELDRFRRADSRADGRRPQTGSRWRSARGLGRVRTRCLVAARGPPSGGRIGVAEVDGVRARIADTAGGGPAVVAGASSSPRPGRPRTSRQVARRRRSVPVHAHPRAPSREPSRLVLRRGLDREDPARGRPLTRGAAVRIGFRRELGRDELVDLIEQERTSPLADAMHLRPTVAGDVWFIRRASRTRSGRGVHRRDPGADGLLDRGRNRRAPDRSGRCPSRVGLGGDGRRLRPGRPRRAWLDRLRHDGRRARRRDLVGGRHPAGCRRRSVLRGGSPDRSAVAPAGPPARTGSWSAVTPAGEGTVRAGGRSLSGFDRRDVRGPSRGDDGRPRARCAVGVSGMIACRPPRPADLTGRRDRLGCPGRRGSGATGDRRSRPRARRRRHQARRRGESPAMDGCCRCTADDPESVTMARRR